VCQKRVLPPYLANAFRHTLETRLHFHSGRPVCVCVWASVCDRESVWETMFVCMCVREKECVREREWTRENVCVCVTERECVCEWAAQTSQLPPPQWRAHRKWSPFQQNQSSNLTPVAGPIWHGKNWISNLQARICKLYPAISFRFDLLE